MILFKDLSIIMITHPPFFCIHIITSHPNLVYLARAHYITKTRFDLTGIIRLQRSNLEVWDKQSKSPFTKG